MTTRPVRQDLCCVARAEKEKDYQREVSYSSTALALLVTAGVLKAQITQKTEAVKGAAQVTTEQMTGEVVWVQGNTLAARMLPLGSYSVFNVKPGREFVIDGQTRHIGDLKLGTVLTATVITTTRPGTVRTTATSRAECGGSRAATWS